MEKRITSSIILVLALAMIIPLTQPTARATGPPYTWAGPTDLNPHVGQDDLPAAVQASNGTLWIAWQTFRFSTTRPDIMYTTLTNGVTGSIARLTSTGFNTSPTLAQQSGVITLLWSQQKTVTFTIYYETFSAPSTWSSPKNATVISNSYNDTGPAATTTTDGTLWLFWQRANQSCTSSCIQTKQIYYKTMKAGTWSVEKRANNLDANWNSYPSAVVTKDGLTRLAWTKGGQGTTQSTTFYKTYNGTSVSSETQITSPPSGFGDQRPSMIQDRNGTMWLFWSRTSLTAPQFVLFDKFSTNAGQSWPASETQMLTEASGVDDQQPAAVQGNSQNDKTIHLFYSSDRTNFDYDIWSIVSPSIAPVHDLGVTAVYPPSSPELYSGGMPSIGQNSNATISIVVTNYGDTGENAQATVKVSNTTTINLGAQTQQISVHGSATFFYNWNTTNPDGSVAKAGRYNILVSVISTNSTETPGNSGDNSVTVRNSIHLFPWGSVAFDNGVTLQDVSIFVFDFGATIGSPRYNPYCDIIGNGVINLLDVSIAVKNFGITT